MKFLIITRAEEEVSHRCRVPPVSRVHFFQLSQRLVEAHEIIGEFVNFSSTHDRAATDL